MSVPEKITPPEPEFILSDKHAWESLFEQDLPDSLEILNVRSIARNFRDSLANIHLIFAIPIAHEKWRSFKASNINAKNTYSISFTPGTMPYDLIRNIIFTPPYYAESISIMDRKMVIELENELRKKRVLRKDGSLAGEILFTFNNQYEQYEHSSTIGIGVVNSDTSEPEGIIFCPVDMFPFKKTSYSGKRKQKRQASQTNTQPALQPIGIPI